MTLKYNSLYAYIIVYAKETRSFVKHVDYYSEGGSSETIEHEFH